MLLNKNLEHKIVRTKLFWIPNMYVVVDIESFWTEDYAGQTPNSGRELAIYVL